MFQFTDSQLEDIRVLVENNRVADAYSLIVQYATDASGDPLPSVDAASLVWFEGAADVNRGVGAFSDFIRSCTIRQHELRLGWTPSADLVHGGFG